MTGSKGVMLNQITLVFCAAAIKAIQACLQHGLQCIGKVVKVTGGNTMGGFEPAG